MSSGLKVAGHTVRPNLDARVQAYVDESHTRTSMTTKHGRGRREDEGMSHNLPSRRVAATTKHAYSRFHPRSEGAWVRAKHASQLTSTSATDWAINLSRRSSSACCIQLLKGYKKPMKQ